MEEQSSRLEQSNSEPQIEHAKSIPEATNAEPQETHLKKNVRHDYDTTDGLTE